MKARPTQLKLCKVHKQTQALKAKHTAIRQAKAATLDRVLATHEMP